MAKKGGDFTEEHGRKYEKSKENEEN